MTTSATINEAYEAFEARCHDGSDRCAHDLFPEANEPATQSLVSVLTEELGMALMADIEAGELNLARLEYGVVHALTMAAAWGMTVGALNALDSAGEELARIDWTDTLANIDPEDLPGPLSD